MTAGATTELADFLEAMPSLVFILLWRMTGDLETAGWVGCALALAVLFGFRVFGVPFDTILLGINIHIVVMTPLIVGFYARGMSGVAEIIEEYSYPAVLITIFLTGAVLNLCSASGFVGVRGLPGRRSWLLLGASAMAAIWGMLMKGGGIVTVGLPVLGLLALRRVLQGYGK